ncbi:hypothetical protein L486_04560 [Kwoniella mangroviensis CBS 10435]|uniref:Alpha 1,6-mannosyltransferase n=1 Tax=Kwoniella mangroviensis CBS 10435 TaxID=1331196 RepID=A0A1B9ISM5_9TREE|nr:hypothetical protein L486_04560 [Kwoniella mangroviensis CBS 10435]
MYPSDHPPPPSSSSSSSSTTSRRSSSEHSSTSTYYSHSPSINTFKSTHSRDTSRSINTNLPKTFDLSGAFSSISEKPHVNDINHEDLEKGSTTSYDLPKSPSLEHPTSSSFSHIPNKVPHLHVGLRRRRILSQLLALCGLLTVLGWWILSIRESPGGIIGMGIGKNGASEHPKVVLPGIIIGSNGEIIHQPTVEEESPLPLEEEKELTHAEKMAELSKIKGPQWGLSLSSDHLLAGLRPFPSSGQEEEDDGKPALSELGKFADQIYNLGTLDPEEYYEQMKEFAKVVFPKKIAEQLQNALDIYVNVKVNGHEEKKGKESWDSTKRIWQTDKTRSKVDTKEVRSWKDGQAFDEGWQWDLLTDSDADKYVTKHLAGSRFKEIWDNLPSGILRSDTLRYLLILFEGGIYSDTDTLLLKPPSAWGQNPKLYKDGQGWMTDIQLQRIQDGDDVDDILGKPSVIVGLEADVGDREDWFDWWPRPIQIVQWTLTSSPFHPIALNALLRIHHSTAKAVQWSHSVSHSIKVLRDQGRYEDAKKLAMVDVMNEPKNGGPVGVMAWTGPGVWTDAVLSYLRVQYGLVWTDLKDLRVPLRIGDVVILPVTGFSPGVGNFGAQGSFHHEAMVQHDFAGSWKNDE